MRTIFGKDSAIECLLKEKDAILFNLLYRIREYSLGTDCLQNQQ